MKRLTGALVAFSRTERLALAVLSLLLICLIIIRCTVTLWAKPKSVDKEEAARMLIAYNNWKASNRGAANELLSPLDSKESVLFSFDPNTLDSAGFIRLGMPPRAVKGLLNWRRHNKHFYKPEDLKPLYNLPEEVYARLEPYIHIGGTAFNEQQHPGTRNAFPEIPAIIDLNAADSATLDRGLPGVGAVLSHKLIERRKALGGFIKVEQIQEVYKFPDTTFLKMKEKLRINPAVVKRMNLNTATLSQMSTHPYVGEKVAKNILLYREGIQHYERVEQLRQVPLMNEEIYRKIAPYFSVE